MMMMVTMKTMKTLTMTMTTAMMMMASASILGLLPAGMWCSNDADDCVDDDGDIDGGDDDDCVCSHFGFIASRNVMRGSVEHRWVPHTLLWQLGTPILLDLQQVICYIQSYFLYSSKISLRGLHEVILVGEFVHQRENKHIKNCDCCPIITIFFKSQSTYGCSDSAKTVNSANKIKTTSGTKNYPQSWCSYRPRLRRQVWHCCYDQFVWTNPTQRPMTSLQKGSQLRWADSKWQLKSYYH